MATSSTSPKAALAGETLVGFNTDVGDRDQEISAGKACAARSGKKDTTIKVAIAKSGKSASGKFFRLL